MSYILDALRQSERRRPQRPAGTDPHPSTGLARPVPRPLRWPYWLLLLLLLAMLGAYLLLKGWLTPAPDVTAQVPAPPPAAAATPAPGQQADPLPIIIDSPPVRILVDEPPPLRLNEPAPARQPQATSPSQPTPIAPARPQPSFDPGVPDLRELPASLRSRLPELVISVHIYSDNPAARMANINGQMLREGQRLGPLQVRMITPKGVILGFEEQEFHLNSVGG